MTATPGDVARAMVMVAVDPATAFAVFTEEIDVWWRRGRRFRIGGLDATTMTLEPRLGGRLFETYETKAGPRAHQIGTVLVWEPPTRLVLEWRNVNFAPNERTEVEVTFEAAPRGTRVTVEHRGWATIRPDHPARHRQAVPEFIAATGRWWGDLAMSLRRVALARATSSSPPSAS